MNDPDWPIDFLLGGAKNSKLAEVCTLRVLVHIDSSMGQLKLVQASNFEGYQPYSSDMIIGQSHQPI